MTLQQGGWRGLRQKDRQTDGQGQGRTVAAVARSPQTPKAVDEGRDPGGGDPLQDSPRGQKWQFLHP